MANGELPVAVRLHLGSSVPTTVEPISSCPCSAQRLTHERPGSLLSDFCHALPGACTVIRLYTPGRSLRDEVGDDPSPFLVLGFSE